LLDAIQNPADPLGNPIKCHKDIPAAGERYIAGEIGLDVDIRVGEVGDGLGGDANHFVAWLYGARAKIMSSNLRCLCRERSLGVVRDTNTNRGFSQGNDSRVQSAVFVFVGEPTESGEWVDLVRIESFGRLQFADGHEDGGSNGLGVIARIPVPARLEDGKLDALSLLLRWLTPKVATCKLPPNMVEGTPKVMDGISEQESPPVGVLGNLIDDDSCAPIGITLSPNGDRVGVSLPSFENVSAKRLQVAVSAFELQAPARERSHALPSPYGCQQAGADREDAQGPDRPDTQAR